MSVRTHNQSMGCTDTSRSCAHTRRVIVLGSTGSIGVQTLEVIEHLNRLHREGRCASSFQVVGLAAGSNRETLLEQAKRFDVHDLSLHDDSSCDQPDQSCSIRFGKHAARELVEQVECDLVVGAIVGVAGLESILRAIELGIDVALANKETLVAAGSLVIQSAKKSGARLLPVDSEHAGVWECLQSLMGTSYCPPDPIDKTLVDRIVLTASGGPFRDQSREHIMHAKIDDALNHPNWSMGKKVTIDSATLMNKALELIEAHWLFGIGSDQLGAIIHPQSIVHAIIECADGTVLTQMGAPDMRTPIQQALSAPDRVQGCSQRLDLSSMSKLEFVEIQSDRFPAIECAMRVIDQGGTSGAILNAANERAVWAYLNDRIPFGMIDRIVIDTLDSIESKPINSFEDIEIADQQAKACVDRMINEFVGINQ